MSSINRGSGKGVAVIKTQIDYKKGHGLLSEWAAYEISRDGSKLIKKYDAFDREFENGERDRNEMKAVRLYYEKIN